MNIRKLKIEHFGSISCFEAVFHSDLIVISGKNSEIIASAVKLLTGVRLSKQEEFLFCSDTARLSAEVELDREEIYYIEIKDSAQTGDYYHAWKPPFSRLRATAIYGIITLESHPKTLYIVLLQMA